MKILHVLDERWDSGLTAYGLESAGALAALGHEVWVAARPSAPAWAKAAGLGLPLIPLEGAWNLGRRMAEINIDLVNAHTGAGHSLAFLATRFRAAALVRTRGEGRRLKPRPGHRFLFRRTDAVIAASRVIAEAYRARFPFLKGRLAVVYPSVEPAASPSEPAGPLRVGCLGRLDPVKGHGVLIRAAALLGPRLGDAEILIAGEEKNVTRASLAAAAAEAGVAGRVRFLGRVEDARAFMSSCHVGVIASLASEAVSRAALEWMAEGRPVAATTVGILPEIVEEGGTGWLVPPEDPGALAAALARFLADPEGRRRMGRRALERVRALFTPDRLGRETAAVYERALAHGRGAA